jgi:hypothetical protein
MPIGGMLRDDMIAPGCRPIVSVSNLASAGSGALHISNRAISVRESIAAIDILRRELTRPNKRAVVRADVRLAKRG